LGRKRKKLVPEKKEEDARNEGHVGHEKAFLCILRKKGLFQLAEKRKTTEGGRKEKLPGIVPRKKTTISPKGIGESQQPRGGREGPRPTISIKERKQRRPKESNNILTLLPMRKSNAPFLQKTCR